MNVTDIIALAGGPLAVGKAVGRHHSTVIGWRRVPAEHARTIAKMAKLHPSQVRPDVYDPPKTEAAA